MPIASRETGVLMDPTLRVAQTTQRGSYATSQLRYFFYAAASSRVGLFHEFLSNRNIVLRFLIRQDFVCRDGILQAEIAFFANGLPLFMDVLVSRLASQRDPPEADASEHAAAKDAATRT